jgi:hypothetical protein
VRRALAVVAAAAMVAGSLALRSRLDRGHEESSKVLRLLCTPELEAACRQLEREDSRMRVSVEAAGISADRLATAEGDPGLDGWMVSGPWPELVDGERRARALPPLFPGPHPALGRSPLVLVVWKDRAAALGPRCPPPGGVGWRCLGDAAGVAGGWAAVGGRPEWGPVKPGHASPASDGIGLLVLGQAVGAWFGRTDLSAADLDDEGFQRWFAGLERAVPLAAAPLETMLVTGPAAFDAAGTTEADAGPLLARSARRDALTLLYPSPMATADAVLAVPAGSESSSLAGVVGGATGRRALAAAGWRVPGQPRAHGVPDSPPLPTTSGLPSAGLLDALRGRWHEVTGR